MSEIVARERDKRSMLTAFFEMNRVDAMARQYLYKDFSRHFTWNASSRRWNKRVIKPQRVRLVSANPAEGERYYLRLLLANIKGPTSFEYLYTVNGVKHTTFRKAALEIGLIENDDSLSQCLTEASLFQFPGALRRLFATIMVFCEPGDIRKLYNDHFYSLSEDYRQHCENVERVQNMVLTDIKVILQSMGKNLMDFDLPRISANISLQSVRYREVQEEYAIIVDVEHLHAKNSLNSDQKLAFDEIMRHVDNESPGVFFIEAPGGTGKTFCTSLCLPRLSKIIIWDEASMAKRQAIEAVDRTMQDIVGVRHPCGGKIMVLGGDFRQVLPVIKRGTRAQIVDWSLRMSHLWCLIKKMHLTLNMRARTDPWFLNFLLRVGNGDEESVDGNYIRIPDDMEILYNRKDESKNALIDAIFPLMETNAHSSDYIISRAILSTKNENVDEINDQLIDKFHGEEKVYYSFDEAEEDRHNFYPIEFLNSLVISGLPPHKLRLKVGCPIILLRNIDPSHGLCNGTRLICKGFQHNVIDAEIDVGQHTGKRVFLPKIPLCPSDDDMFPFKLKRKQFPIRISFAMTINKAHGQTIPHVGVYLPESVFSHGQLYVALSRGISRENTNVLVKPAKDFKQDGVYTSNVVYPEVLHDE